MAKKKYVVGIDIGGTKLLSGILDKQHRVLGVEKSKMDPGKGEKYFLSTLKENIDTVLEDNRIRMKEIAAIGIGCPGIIQVKEGKVILSPNIPFLKNYSLSEKVGKLFNVPVVIEND